MDAYREEDFPEEYYRTNEKENTTIEEDKEETISIEKRLSMSLSTADKRRGSLLPQLVLLNSAREKNYSASESNLVPQLDINIKGDSDSESGFSSTSRLSARPTSSRIKVVLSLRNTSYLHLCRLD